MNLLTVLASLLYLNYQIHESTMTLDFADQLGIGLAIVIFAYLLFIGKKA